MDKSLPDKWIRKAIFALIDDIVVNSETIPCYDYRATGAYVPDYYTLMTVQSNEVDPNNKCEYFWDSEIVLDIITIYQRPGNTGSRLLADDILEAIRAAIQTVQLDVASGLEIINRTHSYPNDLNFVSDNEIIFRKFLRLSLKIK